MKEAYGDQSAKKDAGKIRPTLVPIEAIEDIAVVRGYGNMKYGSSENWKGVEVQRYRDALFRHLLEYIKDPKSKDKESGIEHYKHLICNAAFICALEREQEDGIVITPSGSMGTERKGVLSKCKETLMKLLNG